MLYELTYITPSPTPRLGPNPSPGTCTGGSGGNTNIAIAISIVNQINQIRNIFRSHTTVNNIVPAQVLQTFFLRSQIVPLHLCNGVTGGPFYDIVHQSVIIP